MFLSAVNIVGLLVAVVALGGRGATAADYSYSDADNWANTFPKCGGKQQSPVNFNRFALTSGGTKAIRFNNYDVTPDEQTVTNDGHSVKVEISSISETPYIEWTIFFFIKIKYNFAQLHFHWGSDSTQGSEHTVDTVRYPMEVHLVHFNNKYDDIGTAVTKSDGLAVLGIFFVISQNDNPALAPLISAMGEVEDYTSTDPHTVAKNNLYALASLLPSNTERFYRYDGSLTTPTCDESVLWTVFEEPIEVSEAQMEQFRAMIGSSGSSSDNYRPVQNLNGRKVRTSW